MGPTYCHQHPNILKLTMSNELHHNQHRPCHHHLPPLEQNNLIFQNSLSFAHHGLIFKQSDSLTFILDHFTSLLKPKLSYTFPSLLGKTKTEHDSYLSLQHTMSSNLGFLPELVSCQRPPCPLRGSNLGWLVIGQKMPDMFLPHLDKKLHY